MKALLMVMLAAMSVCGFAADKKIAVFVQNRTSTLGMDRACGAVRERFVSGIAEVSGFTVIDSTMATDAFNTSPNVARQLGCDYVVAISIVGASAMVRNVNGRASTVYSLRMTTKVTDVDGATISGIPTWSRQLPILEAQGDMMGFYDMLFDQWAQETVAAVAQQCLSWRAPSTVAANLVRYRVSTTIDSPIAAFESQTKGVKGEQLAELRKVAGGASVAIDGVVVGTAPCEIMTTPGLHKLTVTREWMTPYEATISVVEGGSINVAMELNIEGTAKWGSIERVQADAAQRYGEAAKERGVKVNIDTSKWRDGNVGGAPYKVKVAD